MNNKILLSALFLLLCNLSNLAFAGMAPPDPTISFSSDERTDNEFFVGLNWELGGSMTPQGVIGYRRAKVDSSGNVDGFSLNYGFLFNGFQPGNIKAIYFDGKENLQGEIGFGYDFKKHSPLGVLGVQAQYINFGTDYIFGNGFKPYGGINSIDGYDKPDEITTKSCPATFTLSADGTACVGMVM